MGLDISDMPPAISLRARPAGKTHGGQGFPHGAAAVAVACGVDVIIGYAANVRSAAKKRAEMSFLVAPCRDFDGAVYVRVGIDHAGGFERIDDAKRPIEPARVILAFEMRPGQQFWSGFRGCAKDVADAVDRSSEACLWKPLREPIQRAHMRLREGRLVNAGLVGADATERIEIRKDPSTIELRAIVRHEP